MHIWVDHALLKTKSPTQNVWGVSFNLFQVPFNLDFSSVLLESDGILP